MSNHSWTPLWPQLEPRILAAQPNGRLPQPNGKGWIGPIRSPLRAEAKPSFSVKPDSTTDQGGFEDHGTGTKGSIADLAILMGIDPRVSIVTPPPAVLTLSTFCDQRKLDPAELSQRWGVRQVQWKGRPALRYPTALGIDRIKYLDKGPGLEKYTWAGKGGGRHWYGLAQALALRGPLYLVNGEPSVWACHQEGIAAVCLCGGEGAAPTPELIAELVNAGVTEVRVVYDRDDKGRDGAPRTVAALQAGGVAGTAFELPAQLGEGGDVDDLHRWEGARLADALAALPELQPAVDDSPPTRKWLTEAELDTLPPPSWLIDGEITASGITVLYGPSGSGKTFYAIDVAMRVAAAEGPVMYLAAEDVQGVALRRRVWRQFHNRTDGTLYVWPEEVNFLNPAEVDSFIDQVQGLGLKMLIVDTLHQCLIGGSDSNDKDMGTLVYACKRIHRATGAAPLLIHHTGKSGTSERGSSALRAAAYTMIELTNEDGLIRAVCDKAKNSAPFPERHLRLLSVDSSCVIVPAENVIDAKGAPLAGTHRKILELLSLAIFENTGARSNQIAQATGIPEGSLWRALSKLKRLGYISQGVKGDPYYITTEGELALRNNVTPTITHFPHPDAQPSPPSPNHHPPSDSSSFHHQSPSHPLRGDGDGRSDGSASEVQTTPAKPPLRLTTEWQSADGYSVPPGADNRLDFNGVPESRLPPVPPAILAAPDLATAIQFADSIKMVIGTQDKRTYQTALSWLHRKRVDKAVECLERLQHAEPQAILTYLVQLAATPVDQVEASP